MIDAETQSVKGTRATAETRSANQWSTPVLDEPSPAARASGEHVLRRSTTLSPDEPAGDPGRNRNELQLDADKVVACFNHYLVLEGAPISRAVAEQRMLEKLTRSLTEDIAPLLPAGVRFDTAESVRAFERVWTELIARLSGEPWKGRDMAVEELRGTRYPGLLRRQASALHRR